MQQDELLDEGNVGDLDLLDFNEQVAADVLRDFPEDTTIQPVPPVEPVKVKRPHEMTPARIAQLKKAREAKQLKIQQERALKQQSRRHDVVAKARTENLPAITELRSEVNEVVSLGLKFTKWINTYLFIS